MLFGAIATQLGSKRLLVVPDGFLQYFPLDALPAPGMAPAQASVDSGPLFLKHEVISIPSALTLAALGKMKNNRDGGVKPIAVIADPVFDRDDPRVGKTQAKVVQAGEDAYLSRSLRSFVVSDTPQKLSRLPSTMREAHSIAEAADGACDVTTGLAATKDYVLNGGVKGHRIVHFATHGLLNSEHPELSGLVLSQLDEHGNARNGFLRVNDIYNLDLSADLIVLSACRTGFGKDVRGEGIVGLPSAFMYAGAKSTVASLWKVDDEATAELMGYFYSAIFNEGLPPAAALRKAKEKMWRQERWRAPFYWAAFVFQGQYSNEIEVPSSGKTPRITILGGVLLVSLASILAIVRFIKRRRRLKAGDFDGPPL
jgi:CHAT domain-containing protein